MFSVPQMATRIFTALVGRFRVLVTEGILLKRVRNNFE